MMFGNSYCYDNYVVVILVNLLVHGYICIFVYILCSSLLSCWEIKSCTFFSSRLDVKKKKVPFNFLWSLLHLQNFLFTLFSLSQYSLNLGIAVANTVTVMNPNNWK